MKHFLKPKLAILFFVGLTLGTFSHARAQGPERKIENRIQKLRDQLNLSDAQVVQVKSIFEEARTKIETLRSAGTDRPTMMAQRKQINKMAMLQVKSLLTDEQKQRWKELKRAKRQVPAPKPGE